MATGIGTTVRRSWRCCQVSWVGWVGWLEMAIEIVDLPSYKMVIFHSYGDLISIKMVSYALNPINIDIDRYK